MLTENSVSSTNWYTWNPPGAPMQVRIPLLLVHELRRRLDRPIDSEETYIPEAGFLIGKVPRPGITQITGFHPVAHLDPPTVLEAVTRNKGNFVGFYRTTAPGTLLLKPDDLLLAEAYFHQASSVVLLIESGSVGPEEAAFFVWRKGRIDGAPLHPFPFDAYQLAGPQRAAIAEPTEPAEPPVVEPPPPAPKPRVTPPAPKARVAPPAPKVRVPAAEEIEPTAVAATAETRAPKPPSVRTPAGKIVGDWFRAHGRPVKWAAPVIALAGLGAFYGVHRHAVRPAAEVSEPRTTAPAGALPAALGLTAERSGTDLVLKWDGQSPAILSASTASLVIQAGSERQELPLSPDQLRSGRFVYTPSTDHLLIRLDIAGRDKAMQEDSMTVFLPREADQRAVVVPRPKAAAQAEASDREAPAAEAKLQAPIKRYVDTGRASSTNALPPRLDEPPPTVLPTTRATAPDPLLSPQLELPRPNLASPPPAVSPSAGATKGPSSVPQPAVAVYQAIPHFPEQLKHTLQTPTSVQVMVTITPAGSVEKAEALPTKNAHVLLRYAAVEAARNWKFRPATINGHAVSSQMVLNFDFTPSK